MENDENKFSLVVSFTVVKSIACLCAQNGWVRKCIQFQSAFRNRTLERLVYAELLKVFYADETGTKRVMRLKRSLYVLRDAALIWQYLLESKFAKARFTQSVPPVPAVNFEKAIQF